MSTPYLGLLDATGHVIGSFVFSGGPFNSPQITYTAASTGTYFLSAQGLGSGETGSYKISASAVSTTLVDDYVATTATTGSVAIGGALSGSIETTGDVDWIKVTLTVGTTYQFDLQGIGAGQGTLSTPYLGLLDATGHVIGSFVFSGGPFNSPQITYTAASTGTYFLSAQGLGSGETGSYKISASAVSTTLVDDVASIKEDTAPNPVVGNVLTNDQDTDGDTLAVTTAGTFALGHGSLALNADGSLRLHPGQLQPRGERAQ